MSIATQTDLAGTQPRAAHVEWILVADMQVSPRAQREYREAHAKSIADNFNIEALGFLTVNRRADGSIYVIDGQHRMRAVRDFMVPSWADQMLECEVYEGMTEAEEAALFLVRDQRKAIPVFQKYKINITAGNPETIAIDNIVASLGLRVTQGKAANGVSCVGTLQRIYTELGAPVLGKSLAFVRDSFGDAGFQAYIIEGMALVVERFGDVLDGTRLVESLNSMGGGVAGLIGQAENLRLSTGRSKSTCVAAVITKQYNRSAGRNLPDWWKAGS